MDLSYSLNLNIPRLGAGAPPPPVIDPDAQDYFDRVVAQLGTLNVSTRNFVNQLIIDLKAQGVWTKINRMNLFCTDTFAGMLVPIKVSPGAALDVNGGFVSGDYNPTIGLTNNASAKSLHTGAGAQGVITNISSGVRPTLGFFVFVTQPVNPNPYVEFDGSGLIGARSATTQCTLMIANIFGDRVHQGGIGSIGQTIGDPVPGAGAGAPRGLYGVRRILGGQTRLSRNGSNVAAPLLSSNFFPTATPVRVGARDNPTEDYLNGSIGGYIITAGPGSLDFITDSNLLSLYTIVDTFQMGMGRV